MGGSNRHERAPKAVAIECGSIIKEALLCLPEIVGEPVTRKGRNLLERIGRQQSMIRDQCGNDVWISLYHSLLEVTQRQIRASKLPEEDLEGMFDVFADYCDDTRAEYDLATQILLLVNQMLRYTLEARDMTVTERFSVHRNMAETVRAAHLRFRWLAPSIRKSHRGALTTLFQQLEEPYEQKGAGQSEPQMHGRPEADANSDSSENVTPTAHGRLHSKSRKACYERSAEWSSEHD